MGSGRENLFVDGKTMKEKKGKKKNEEKKKRRKKKVSKVSLSFFVRDISNLFGLQHPL